MSYQRSAFSGQWPRPDKAIGAVFPTDANG